jgi:MoxR-like ATPase
MNKTKLTELGQRRFRGDGTCPYKPLPEAYNTPEPYAAQADLIEAVNLALHLRRPLLLEGEPGCGKTRLAHAVAFELGFPLQECYIRSTSKARDLLYTFDAVRRLYDIQEIAVRWPSRAIPRGEESQPVPMPTPVQSRSAYVTLGKLGEAIKLSQENIPTVVLIDEIDKADLDFPNDLLLELDRLKFEIDEAEDGRGYDALAGKTRQQRTPALPLILVTSNREKELPRPFLRRCLYYFVRFPDPAALQGIIERHSGSSLTPLYQEALNKFWQLRQQSEFRWRKIPSASELLDWIQALERDETAGKLDASRLAQLSLPDLPHLATLVKTQGDLEALKRRNS